MLKCGRGGTELCAASSARHGGRHLREQMTATESLAKIFVAVPAQDVIRSTEIEGVVRSSSDALGLQPNATYLSVGKDDGVNHLASSVV